MALFCKLFSPIEVVLPPEPFNCAVMAQNRLLAVEKPGQKVQSQLQEDRDTSLCFMVCPQCEILWLFDDRQTRALMKKCVMNLINIQLSEGSQTDERTEDVIMLTRSGRLGKTDL